MTIINHEDFKAIWLSQFDMVDVYTSNDQQRDADDFEEKIDQILLNVKNMGFNTVIIQTRPNCDSIYPSDFFPPSKYAVGGYDNDFSYDPIKIIVDKCHKQGLSVQGWINPLRCMNVDELRYIDNKYKIKQWYNDQSANGTYIVEYNGKYYLNPAYDEVVDYILQGVDELLQRYDFDGIHMDDYFYPTTSEEFDDQAFDEYITKYGDISRKDFRHKNINNLVKRIYNTVKESNSNKLFGISPEGNINSAINTSFADVSTWCAENGYIDYICPQIYWGFEHQTHPFNKVCDDWSALVTNKKVKLFIGITLGKAYSKEDQWSGSGKDEWKNYNDIIKRSVEYTLTLDKCSGVSFFSYQYFYNVKTNERTSQTADEVDNMLLVFSEASWK